MANSMSLRRRYWSYVFAWVVLIYATLYSVRPVCNFLKNTTPFALLVNILMFSLLIVIMMSLLMKRIVTRPSSYIFLFMTVAAYIYGFLTIQFPEEKIHFIEYGILAWLIIQAVELDVRRPAAHVYAFLLTAIFGWMDEGIQHLLPNRYYQFDDVILNATSGLLGLFLTHIIKREHM
jgi:VanZ family protein